MYDLSYIVFVFIFIFRFCFFALFQLVGWPKRPLIGRGSQWVSKDLAARSLSGAPSLAGLRTLACAAAVTGDTPLALSRGKLTVRGKRRKTQPEGTRKYSRLEVGNTRFFHPHAPTRGYWVRLVALHPYRNYIII